MRFIFFIFLLSGWLVVASAAPGNFTMNGNCRDAYARLMTLQFSKADEIISAEKKTNPNNHAVLFLEHKKLFLTAFITEQEKDFIRLKKGKEEFIHILEKGNPDNPYYRMAEAEILLQTAVMKIKFREFVSAAFEIRKAYKLLEANKNQHPDFYANLKGLGVLHAMIGAVPDNYKWVVRLIGFEGSIRQGIAELKMVLNRSQKDHDFTWLQEETLFLLVFSEHHLHRDEKATNELIRMIDMKQSGPLLFFVVTNYYNTTGQSAKTLSLMQTYREIENSFPMPYLDYMHGSAHLFNLDPKASHYFNLFLTRFKGMNFIRSARQKLAWVSFIQGDTASYHSQLKKIPEIGNDFSDEDKQAMKEASSGEYPNLYLLRARLLFDGGYYQRALAEIAGKKLSGFPSLKDQLELTYRMGRIFDKTGQKEKAMEYYETTFNNGQRQTWYFAANAALNLGMLYEETGAQPKAQEWYRKCLALRNHEYQNSIDQKAEAGLNRLRK